MIWKSLLFIILICIAAHPQDSFMPQPFNFDSTVYLPKLPSEILDSTLPYFKQIVVDSGKISPKNGILISDRTAGEYIFYKAGYVRQDKELNIAKYLLGQYYVQSKAAEKIYQSKISALTVDCKRSWLEKNSIYIGLVCGITTAVLTEALVLRASK